jgi:hypothetical protein
VPAQPADEISRRETRGQKALAKPTKARAKGATGDLIQILFENDAKFAELVESNRRLEKRLNELSAHRGTTVEENAEEANLKKKKLYLKDQMDLILRRYKEQSKDHH